MDTALYKIRRKSPFLLWRKLGENRQIYAKQKGAVR